MGGPAPFQPMLGQQSPNDTVAQLRAQVAQLQAQAAHTPAGQVQQAKAGFTVPAGEEGYIHALVTHKSGVAVERPRVEPYHPAVYRALAKTEGFTAEVLHDPATIPAPAATAPYGIA